MSGTHEEMEELGLNDMRVEDYAEDAEEVNGEAGEEKPTTNGTSKKEETDLIEL